MPKKKQKEFRLAVPESFKRYLILVASGQNMELIPPTEMYMNIEAYISEKRGVMSLEIEKLAKLRAYINKWKLQDFTQGG